MLRLWSTGRRPPSRGRKFRWMPFPPVFILELLILLLLVFAALLPFFPDARRTPPLTLILDNSYSMRAGKTDSAHILALQHLKELGTKEPRREFRVILAGRGARHLGSYAGNELVARLTEHWLCDESDARFPEAFLVAERLETRFSERLVISDHRWSDSEPPPGCSYVAFGRPRENFAITGAVREPHRVMFLVGNFSDTARETELTAGAARQKLLIPPGDFAKVVFPLSDDVGTLDAFLSPDILDFDQSIRLLPENPPPVRVQLVLSEERRKAVATAFQANPRVRLTDENPELLVSDSALPPNAPQSVSLLDGDGKTFSGPVAPSRNSPLLDGLDFRSVLWSVPAKPLTGAPLLQLGETFLITHRGRRIEAVWSPKSSNWHLTPSWPGWWYNVTEFVAGNRTGLTEHNYSSGAPVRLRLPAGERELVIVPEGRTAYRLFPDMAQQVILEKLPVGPVKLQAGNHRWELIVNPLNAAESDLRGLSSEHRSTPSPQTEHLGRIDLVWAPLLAALALLGVHQWYLRRRREI